ncbi:MAG: hypothetical protein JSV82_04775 [Planctomycetota bacterium]|nr:MAG: hypothetical protein JSV82_04775 [Planctomycetota bacterium]
MVNRLANVLCWLVLMVVLIVLGCQQKQVADASAYEPDVAERVVAGTYATRAIRATGGYQSWLKTKSIELDCVATFYNADGSFYLTEQHHEVCPWLDSIRISAREPQGRLVWQLSGESFRVLEANVPFGLLPTPIYARDFAEVVLNMTTAPIRFLDSRVEFDEALAPVRMEGLWYYPIEKVSRDLKPYWSQVTLYQNKDTSFVDIIWLADVEKDRYLTVRGYDYSKIDKKTLLVPTKIEIFKTNAKGVLQQRLVTIDYYSLKSTE